MLYAIISRKNISCKTSENGSGSMLIFSIGGDTFDTRDAIKDAGYHWNNADKRWQKRIFVTYKDRGESRISCSRLENPDMVIFLDSNSSARGEVSRVIHNELLLLSHTDVVVANTKSKPKTKFLADDLSRVVEDFCKELDFWIAG